MTEHTRGYIHKLTLLASTIECEDHNDFRTDSKVTFAHYLEEMYGWNHYLGDSTRNETRVGLFFTNHIIGVEFIYCIEFVIYYLDFCVMIIGNVNRRSRPNHYSLRFWFCASGSDSLYLPRRVLCHMNSNIPGHNIGLIIILS